MPSISSFYGIVIWMYFDDHNPPHFHAEYGEHRVRVGIDSLEPLDSGFPAEPCASSVNGEVFIKTS